MSFSSETKSILSGLELKKDCCRQALEQGKQMAEFKPLSKGCDNDAGCYFRGIFLKIGFVSSPEKNFMLTLDPKNDRFCEYLTELLFGFGLEPRVFVRKDNIVIYFKESETIQDFFSFIGGTKVALEIASAKVMSDVRNNTNRLCNAETANIDRAAKAAAEQSEAIKKLQKHGLLDNLSPELKECALLRLDNPDMNLEQLRKQFREPISKSGLNYRLKRLIYIASTLDDIR